MQALQQPGRDTFSFHTHCSCVILGWIFGKRPGSGKARKTRRLPLDKSNIYTGFETGLFCIPLPPGWKSPCKTSSFPQQHPVLAKHSLKPELLRRLANSQQEAREALGTAGVTQQGDGWLLAAQETSVAAAGPGPGPAGAPSARRTPPGLQGWMACQEPNACTTAWGPSRAAGKIGVLV